MTTNIGKKPPISDTPGANALPRRRGSAAAQYTPGAWRCPEAQCGTGTGTTWSVILGEARRHGAARRHSAARGHNAADGQAAHDPPRNPWRGAARESAITMQKLQGRGECAGSRQHDMQREGTS